MKKAFIEFQKVTREYRLGACSIKAANDISFQVNKGEMAVILGPSGAGKSTVLNLLGGMDRVTTGHIYVDGQDITACREKELTDYRAKKVGFVFQFYNLISLLTAYENVALMKEVTKEVMDPKEALNRVGLDRQQIQFPGQLSGGEQQRVSIARAICKNPAILLCDEPTGALDSKTGVTVLQTLQDMCRKQGNTVVIVTHNQLLAEVADRVVRMKNGIIESLVCNPNPKEVSEVEW